LIGGELGGGRIGRGRSLKRGRGRFDRGRIGRGRIGASWILFLFFIFMRLLHKAHIQVELNTASPPRAFNNLLPQCEVDELLQKTVPTAPRR